MDRGCGRPPLGVYHAAGTGSNYEAGNVDAVNGDRPSALLQAAGKRRDAAYRAELEAELRRIEAEEAQRKAERADELSEARAAQARGEEISPVLAMLIAVKDDTEDQPAAAQRADGIRRVG